MDGQLTAGNQYMLIHSKQMAFYGLGNCGDSADKKDKRLFLGISSKKMYLGLKQDPSQVGMSDI